MSWKTPKIVEVPVGMEINMYACAARKQAPATALHSTEVDRTLRRRPR